MCEIKETVQLMMGRLVIRINKGNEQIKQCHHSTKMWQFKFMYLVNLKIQCDYFKSLFVLWKMSVFPVNVNGKVYFKIVHWVHELMCHLFSKLVGADKNSLAKMWLLLLLLILGVMICYDKCKLMFHA